MLLTVIDLLVELLGQRPKDETEFVEPQLFRLSGVEVNHVVVLDPATRSEIVDIVRRDVSFVTDVKQLE